MRSKNRMFPILVVAVLASAFVLGGAGSAYAAYSSVYSNYKTQFDPETNATGKFTVLLTTVSSTFKVFVPPGATKVTMIVYARQGYVCGAAARVDKTPQCSYNENLSPSQAELLPWDAPKSGTLGQMRAKDYQMNNVDGQIEVLDWGMSPLTGVGHWIYVRLLNFENSSPWAEVNFTVNVNMDAYTAWYNSDPDPFNGNQPPNTTGSSSAGTCEADWSQGCTGSNCGSSGTPTNTCDQSGAITCQFGGGVWDVTNCTCSTGGGNTGGNTGGTTGGNVSVSITNPTHNQTVSGTVIFRSSPLSEEEGVDIASVLFKVDGSPVATAVTSPPFNQAFDTTTISDGSHSLTATATDTNGESATSGTYSFNVANGGSGSGSESPTVELTSPANGDALSGAMVMMMANADDDVAVAGVQFQVDGQNAGAEDVSSPYRVNLDTTTLSNGTHVVTAIARDGDGNATTSEGATVSVNNGSSGVSDPDPDQVFTAELFPIANWRIVHVGDVAAPVAPTLEFPEGLEGRYDCFAVYAQDGDLYLAEPNIAGAMVFRRFRDGDNIKYFERKTFHGETSWTPGVFSSLPTPNMEIIESRGVLFLLAVAPVEGGPLEGVIFTFRK